MLRRVSLLLFFFTTTAVFAQRHTIDSISVLLPSMKEDTTKVNSIIALSSAYKTIGSYDTGISKANDAIAMARRIHSDFFLANSYLIRGQSNDLSGKFPDALSDYFIALHIYDSIYQAHPAKDHLNYSAHKSMAAAYGNIGIIYQAQGDLENAMTNQLADLAIAQELDDTRLLGNAYNNLGAIYTVQNKFQLALNSFNQALTYKKKLGSNRGMASTYSNIGSIYTMKADSCAGNSAAKKNFNALAMENFKASLALYEKLGSPAGIIANKIGMAIVYRQDKPVQAKKLLLEALEPALQIGYLDGVKSCYSALYKTDSLMNNFKEGYEYLKLYVKYRDSLLNAEATKKSLGEQMQHDFDKQRAKVVATQEQKEALDAEADSKSKIVLWFASGGVLLVLVFAVFIVRSFRQKAKDNVAVSLQKAQIEMKQKEILDSIHYAKRIQLSLLPNEKVMERKISELKK